MSEYRRLNFGKLNFSDDTISYDEAIKNVEPFKMINIDLDGEKISVVDEKIVCLTS